MGKSMGMGVLLAMFVFGVVAEVGFKSRKLDINLAGLPQGLLVVVLTMTVVIFGRKASKLNLPPGPVALPVVGNWLQVSHPTFLNFSLPFRNLAIPSQPVIFTCAFYLELSYQAHHHRLLPFITSNPLTYQLLYRLAMT